MKLKLLIIYFFLISLVSAQTASQAESLFNGKKYAEAKTIYGTLLRKRPQDPALNFKYARCCYELKINDLAIKHFEISLNKFPQSELYLAELYFNNYNFEQSALSYRNYNTSLDSLNPQLNTLLNKQKKAELGSKLIRRVEDITIVDSVIVSKNDFLKYYKIANELGTLEQKKLKLNARTTTDKIIYTTQRKDRMCFSDSANGNMDIFTAIKLFDTWSLPTSISKRINTEANENYPFFLLDGVTMYFASEGSNSLGGYDIFVTKYSSVTQDYLQPENIGFPFNSFANDYMMVVDEQNKLAWFATDRNQSSGKVIIYKYIFNAPKSYVPNDDIVNLINSARLKTYKRADVKKMTIDSPQQQNAQRLKNKTFIVINDSTFYSSTSDFKSKEALKNYSDYSDIASNLKLQHKEIAMLRLQYDNVEEKDAKNKLAELIITKEEYIFKLEQLKITKELLFLREENLHIEKN